MEEYQDQVEGRNSVIELLESKKDVNKIFIEKGEKHRVYLKNNCNGKAKKNCYCRKRQKRYGKNSK